MVFEGEGGRERLAGLEGCFFVFQGENCRVNLGFCFRIFIVDKGGEGFGCRTVGIGLSVLGFLGCQVGWVGQWMVVL